MCVCVSICSLMYEKKKKSCFVFWFLWLHKNEAMLYFLSVFTNPVLSDLTEFEFVFLSRTKVWVMTSKTIKSFKPRERMSSCQLISTPSRDITSLIKNVGHCEIVALLSFPSAIKI